MLHEIAATVKVFAVMGAVSSIVYYLVSLWSAARFLRKRRLANVIAVPTPQVLPAVSILKPLKGTDPEMYESFCTHCLQNYPEYEIIFGVSDPDDHAVKLVERLIAEFPQRAIRLVICEKNLGANRKVSNLAQMVSAARYEYLVVNDSDIRVEADYLQRVLAPLNDPGIGLVTCLYRGMDAGTLGSRLESLSISTDFCPGVLVAQSIEGGIRFGLGSTLAFRRRELHAMGGFEAVADYLADDYQAGIRIAGLGLKVELSDVVVETFLPAYTLRGFLDHQLRWARTIRDSRYWGYVGWGLTFGFPWAVLALVLAGGAVWAWVLLASVTAARLTMALTVAKSVLGDRQGFSSLALIPLRDAIGFIVWLTSFTGHRVAWRGDSFRLQNGKLVAMQIGSRK